MLNRREFVAGGAALFTARAYSQIAGSTDRLRIGVIGGGAQGSAHMRALVKMRETDNLEIAAVCDIYKPRAERASQLTGGKIVPDYRHLLDNRDIDYILVASPEHWHAKMVLDAIDAGKHVYCEKPMTHTIEESKRIVDRMRSAKVKAPGRCAGYVGRFLRERQSLHQGRRAGPCRAGQIDYSRNYVNDFWTNKIDDDCRPGDNLD